jgi:hypothetical protein
VHLARHSMQRYMPQEGQRVEKRTHSNYQPADATKEAENVTAQPHTWKHTHAASDKRNAVFVPVLFFYNAKMFIKANSPLLRSSGAFMLSRRGYHQVEGARQAGQRNLTRAPERSAALAVSCCLLHALDPN